MSAKNETGGGGWVHLKGKNGMSVFVVGSKSPWAESGGPFLLFEAQMDLEKSSHLVYLHGIQFLHSRPISTCVMFLHLSPCRLWSLV